MIMKIREVDGEEYGRVFPAPAVVYNSVAFTALNAGKVDGVVRAVVEREGGAPVVGLTLGRRDGVLRGPFSAPFAALDSNRRHGAGVMIEAARALREAYPGAQLTLPPPIYTGTTDLLAFTAAGATLRWMDWNYHLDLSRPVAEVFTSAARNKLRQAERSGLRLEPAEAARAYEVIRLNRERRGYDLAMTLAQVEATTGRGGPIRAGFFVLTDGREDAAAAMVYEDIVPGVAQVIYWGDVPSGLCRHPMNLLAALLAAHYASRSYRILDIGPSGAEGHPSEGLSDFKDSLGCTITAKPTLIF